ncbi:hypothetical protein KDD17_01690 [Sulfitobacter albidus]|uniref:Uncharacterized protein n=1 Tax=Sulfitobacter albidus TaxID=2829501 RepID=A0A975JEZ9_9RHOB|nr:hypothetical protein [Sulfitobacter albidus]QUJ76800.1 hypothetical protein KDD17_01690 [Sulfitobacter albidus]
MANPEFILLGDSHATAIGLAAREAGLAFAGGPLASGRDFYVPFCEDAGGKLRFLDGEMEALHAELCAEVAAQTLLHSNLPILCTVGSGFHVAATTALWSDFISPDGQLDAGFIESALFAEICDEMFDPAMQFYRMLREAGCAVQVALPPQRCPETSDAPIMIAFQARAQARLHELGCGIIDTRATTAPDGTQDPAFCKAADPVHGNVAFGAEILRAAGYLA